MALTDEEIAEISRLTDPDAIKSKIAVHEEFLDGNFKRGGKGRRDLCDPLHIVEEHERLIELLKARLAELEERGGDFRGGI